MKVEDILSSGKSFKADTLEELAQKAGINGKNLVETVKKWNEFCKKGTGDEMGRPTCMDDHRLDEGGPYYATLMTPSVHHTMGGVKSMKKPRLLITAAKSSPVCLLQVKSPAVSTEPTASAAMRFLML